MKDFILIRLLRFIGKRLDGYKTKIGGVGFILVGLLGMLRIMFPDLSQLPDMTLEGCLASISAGITALGLAGKADKLKDAVEHQGRRDAEYGKVYD